MKSPVLLILGAGSNFGNSVARKFAANGYKVALASRSTMTRKSKDGYLHIQTDLEKRDKIESVFESTQEEFGIPNLVVYNAHAESPSPVQDLFVLPLSTFKKDLVVNLDSAYVAAQEAVKGFKQLPNSVPKVFIYTGNILNQKLLLGLFSLGVGNFYYADERFEDGRAVAGSIDGNAHAEFYWSLVRSTTQGPWLATFVKEKGYIAFPSPKSGL